MPNKEATDLAEAIIQVKERVTLCLTCQNVTDSNPCQICVDQQRDHSIICIVEEALDILALERTRTYTGLYHVLHGVISPMDGIGPEELKIRELLARLQPDANDPVKEIILATNFFHNFCYF